MADSFQGIASSSLRRYSTSVLFVKYLLSAIDQSLGGNREPATRGGWVNAY